MSINSDDVGIYERSAAIDFEHIHNVLVKAHGGNTNVSFDTTNLTEAELDSRIRAGGTTFLAVVSNEVVGTMTICIEKCDKWYAKGKTAVLRYIAVLPECSGRGIAGRLISACVGWAQEHGVSTLLWTTAANNRASIATAEKNLFQKMDYFKFKRIDHPSVRLVRWLNGKTPNQLYCKGFYLLRKSYVSLRFDKK